MPEDKEDKVIDIPTDGPGAEVTLPEEPVKEGAQIVDVPAEKPEGEVEVKDEPKKELTKRMRESERQRDEATKYEQSVLRDKKSLESRLTKLDTGYVSEMEKRLTSSLDAAKAKLTTAREAGNITEEVDAQREIAKLGYEEARLAEMKLNQEDEKILPRY